MFGIIMAEERYWKNHVFPGCYDTIQIK